MLRCVKSVGYFRITFTALHETPPYHVQIIGHHDIYITLPDGRVQFIDGSPVVGNEKVWEGELCEHEISWMKGLPGREYKASYDFKVEKIPAP